MPSGVAPRSGSGGASSVPPDVLDWSGTGFCPCQDVPVKFLMVEMKRLYPKLCQPGGLRGDMEREGGKR